MSIAQNYPALKPSLLLDFANTKKLDSRVTFARASEGRYYGQEVAKAEENLLAYSQEFDNAYWQKNNTTISANATTAPDGTTTAELIYPNSTGTFRDTGRANVPLTSGAVYTWSFFAKANGINWVCVYTLGGGSGTTAVASFDLQNGVVGQLGSFYSSHSITGVGNGWYRCVVTGTASAATGYPYIVLADGDGSITVTANGTDGVYIWGAQFEQRSSVTAYTPTTTQPITNYIPVLQTASANVARFDHNPVTGESLGLLVEEQRTNLVTYSEQFDNAVWTKTRTSVDSNVVVAPDGTLSGDKLIPNTDNLSHFVSKSVTVTSTAHTQSIYAKAGEKSVIQFNNQSTNDYVNFNLSNGTVGTASGYTATITSVGNGWYKCSATLTYVASTLDIRFTIVDSSTSARLESFTGDGYSGIYIWGAQLEAGAFPTSYIPTTTSQVTRSADSASMTGENFSSLYSQGEGTLYAEMDGISSQFFVQIDDGTNNNRHFINSRESGTIGSGYVLTATNGVNQVSFTTSNFVDTNKIAYAFERNNCSASINGNAVNTDTNAIMPVVNTLRLGVPVSGAYSGYIKKLSYYPQALTATNLQALTS